MEQKKDELEIVRPIIIKRIKKSGHAFHGGSWKVAFADFATAMMAFFLLLWLMGNTSEAEKEAISGYFQDPSGVANLSGATTSIIGEGGADNSVIELGQPKKDLTTESEKELTEELSEKSNLEDALLLAEKQELLELEHLKDNLEELVANNIVFEKYKDQVLIDITQSGLRIQIVDKDKRPMFDSGRAELKRHSLKILKGLAQVLKDVPNKLSITGHTDATLFNRDFRAFENDEYAYKSNYGNWELSADRANAARRALNQSGINENKIARVEGFASSVLFDKANPLAPINRRIAIIVLKNSVADHIQNEALGVR